MEITFTHLEYIKLDPQTINLELAQKPIRRM